MNALALNPYVFEFLGTLVLVLFGDGVCAACSLNKSKAKGAGWVVISLAWGLAVMMGVLVAGPVSGAHLNPAVTLGLAIAGKFAWGQVLGYCLAQMLGGFVGALLVYVFYKDHYKATSDEPDTMLGTFCTMPAIWNPWRNFLSELKVDGGASRNNLMMQFQADVLDTSVIRPQVTETTAMGACYLAGLAVGFWSSLDEIKAQWQAERVCTPSGSDTAALKAGWADAISRTLSK